MVIRVVSWNVAQRVQTVAAVLDMDAAVALLEEAGQDIFQASVNAGGDVGVSHPDPWEPWPRKHYGFRPVVAKPSERVKVERFCRVMPSCPQEPQHEIAASNIGIMLAARIIPLGCRERFIGMSMPAL